VPVDRAELGIALMVRVAVLRAFDLSQDELDEDETDPVMKLISPFM
jgi:hypothetical protein